MSSPNSILRPRPVREMIAESPLVPVALAASLGLLADRYLHLPVSLELVILAVSLIGGIALVRRGHRYAPVALWCAAGALAALHHYRHQNLFPSDDIGNYASEDAKLVRLRGTLDDEPTPFRPAKADPLASYTRPDPTRAMLDAREIMTDGGWVLVSGKAHLTVEGPLTELHVGDEVEVLGWLESPRGPANPGELDWRVHLRDDRIRAALHVRRTPGAVVRLAEGWSGEFRGWLARLRGWGQGVCERELPREQSGVAAALLLGDGSGMRTADWDKYVRTGVVHVLAISGQQLVILAVVVGVVLRLCGVRRRSAALIVAGLLLGYALLTGFRPPVQRAAVGGIVVCLTVFLRRVPLPANTFALAWLVVILLNPADPFGMGCQLAFVQVGVLTWGIPRLAHEPDQIEELIEKFRSPTERFVRGAVGWVGKLYLITLVLGFVALPLVAARQNVVCLSGFLIGPPVVILMSVAMVFGFLMLLVAPLGLAEPFAWVVRWSLAGCDVFVGWGERVPFGHVYTPGVPEWWLWVFYLALLGLLWLRPWWPRKRWFALGGAAWAVVGLTAPSFRPAPDELRVTFVAVGHGGCTVMEPPDGRVLVYDAGAMSGPEVTRRHIAPYLWWRGHRRIDELFLSHADLDHFNGVSALLERFEIGQVTCTPSFADKELPGVRRTLAAIREHGVPIRIVKAGDVLTSGPVTLEVLHPPAVGPAGNENTRSMVLRVQHAGHSILLTGDLESAGLDLVTSAQQGNIDVLMAPHHGSPTANTPWLARWARPRLVVTCEARPRKPREDEPYDAIRAEVWVTGVEGAITVHSHSTGLTAETFRTGRRVVLKSESH